MKKIIAVAALLGASLFGGCQTKPLYSWSSYPNIIYSSYRAPDKFAPAVQIERLGEDIKKATAKGLLVPPGVHAQLGYAYLNSGNPGKARKQFEAEKATFPESAVFMDRLITQINTP